MLFPCRYTSMLNPRPPIPPMLMDWKFLTFQSKLYLCTYMYILKIMYRMPYAYMYNACKCNVPFHVHNSYVHNYHPYLKHKVYYNDLHLYDIILECHSKFLSCLILATLIRNACSWSSTMYVYVVTI